MIVVIGEHGQLASSFKEISKLETLFINSSQLDLRDTKEIIPFLTRYAMNASVIVNFSAYNLVDSAEKYPTESNLINHLAPGEIAKFCDRHSKALIHFSSDYVFNGEKDKPYSEDDLTGPLNIYGQTKLDGEKAIKELCSQFLIIRTSTLYDLNFSRSSFVSKIIKSLDENQRIFGANDIFSSPTYVQDLAEITLEILQNSLDLINGDILHITNSGYVSRYNFIKEIYNFYKEINKNISCEITEVSNDYFNLPAQRPNFSALSNKKAEKLIGKKFPSWQESLYKCLRKTTW